MLAALHMMPPGLGLGLLFVLFNLAVETKAVHVLNFLAACSTEGAAWAAAEALHHFHVN